MLLKGKKAYLKWLDLIRNSNDFVYMIVPWFSEKVANAVRETLNTKDVTIVLKDMGAVNRKTVEMFDKTYLHFYPELHVKFTVGDAGLMMGSSNYTINGFFKNREGNNFYGPASHEWEEWLDEAYSIVETAILYDDFRLLNSSLTKIEEKNPFSSKNDEPNGEEARRQAEKRYDARKNLLKFYNML